MPAWRRRTRTPATTAWCYPEDGSCGFRPVAPGDVDGLVALYRTLSDEDRHLRFFSTFVPDRAFCERLATVEGRGGFGVVAVEAGGRIVGEANYERLSDGDGELGMASARACPTSRPTSW